MGRRLPVEPEPEDPQMPWFTSHVGLSVHLSLSWLFGSAAVAFILCEGEPDVIDALVYLAFKLAVAQ